MKKSAIYAIVTVVVLIVMANTFHVNRLLYPSEGTVAPDNIATKFSSNELVSQSDQDRFVVAGGIVENTPVVFGYDERGKGMWYQNFPDTFDKVNSRVVNLDVRLYVNTWGQPRGNIKCVPVGTGD